MHKYNQEIKPDDNTGLKILLILLISFIFAIISIIINNLTARHPNPSSFVVSGLWGFFLGFIISTPIILMKKKEVEKTECNISYCSS